MDTALDTAERLTDLRCCVGLFPELQGSSLGLGFSLSKMVSKKVSNGMGFQNGRHK
jgi:hypothetical protein